MYLIFLMTDRANAREPMKSLISWACTVDKINRGLIFMNKKKFTYITALTLLSFTLMTGCTNERKENQTAYRQIGINAMETAITQEPWMRLTVLWDSALGKSQRTN